MARHALQRVRVDAGVLPEILNTVHSCGAAIGDPQSRHHP
jgi:hypothetical protein